MFRTGLPFGFLLVGLLLLTLFGIGLLALVVGWRWRIPVVRWAGAGLCVLIVILVAGNALYDASIEWNPIIREDAQIVGVWTDDKHRLTLEPDHTFTYQEAGRTAWGTWKRNDWTLFLHGDLYQGEMQFIQFRGTDRLMTHPLGDPDTWDGDLGLRMSTK